MFKTHSRHQFKGRGAGRGARLLNKMGTLTPITRINELLIQIANEKKDVYANEWK